MTEKYSLGDAQKEAELLGKKIESGEVSSYGEAERHLEREKLMKAKVLLEDELQKKRPSTKDLAEAMENLRNTGLDDLSNEILFKAIPKKIALMMEELIVVIGTPQDTGDIFNDGLPYAAVNSKGNSTFQLPLLKFLADAALAYGALANAEGYYQMIGDDEKAQEVMKLRGPKHAPFIESNKSRVELHEFIRKAGSEFLKSVKDTEGYKVDFEEVVRGIIERIDKELTKNINTYSEQAATKELGKPDKDYREWHEWFMQLSEEEQARILKEEMEKAVLDDFYIPEIRQRLSELKKKADPTSDEQRYLQEFEVRGHVVYSAKRASELVARLSGKERPTKQDILSMNKPLVEMIKSLYGGEVGYTRYDFYSDEGTTRMRPMPEDRELATILDDCVFTFPKEAQAIAALKAYLVEYNTVDIMETDMSRSSTRFQGGNIKTLNDQKRSEYLDELVSSLDASNLDSVRERLITNDEDLPSMMRRRFSIAISPVPEYVFSIQISSAINGPDNFYCTAHANLPTLKDAADFMDFMAKRHIPVLICTMGRKPVIANELQ